MGSTFLDTFQIWLRTHYSPNKLNHLRNNEKDGAVCYMCSRNTPSLVVTTHHSWCCGEAGYQWYVQEDHSVPWQTNWGGQWLEHSEIDPCLCCDRGEFANGMFQSLQTRQPTALGTLQKAGLWSYYTESGWPSCQSYCSTTMTSPSCGWGVHLQQTKIQRIWRLRVVDDQGTCFVFVLV